MPTHSKPSWHDLPEEIRNAWLRQTQAFYPEGRITLDDMIDIARYEYEQSESESLLPVAETAPDGETP